jgi:zinc D-Ala-D-Ala carboxypeptidase
MNEDVPEQYRSREARYADAVELLSVGIDLHGRQAWLGPGAAQAWQSMKADAKKNGTELLLVSGFRSVAYQRQLVRKKRERGLSWEDILRVSAYPGFSEHHTGRAVDIAAPSCPRLEEQFEDTPEFRWLEENALRYGYQMSFPRENQLGVIYEPWHWYWHEGEPDDAGNSRCASQLTVL